MSRLPSVAPALSDADRLLQKLEEERLRLPQLQPSRRRFASTQPITVPVNPNANEELMASIPPRQSLHPTMRHATV